MSEIIMPKMGDAMTEGKVVRWYKKAGDVVKKGEPVLEIETDKVNLDLEAEQDGTIADVAASEGQVVQVGGVLAKILKEGEAGAATEAPPAEKPEEPEASGATGVPPVETAAEPETEPSGEKRAEKKLDKKADQPAEQSQKPAAETAAAPHSQLRRAIDKKDSIRHSTGEYGEAMDMRGPRRDRTAAASASNVVAMPKGEERRRSSPLARKMAQELGVNIESIQGSGPRGRIIAADVKAQGSGAPAIVPAGEAKGAGRIANAPLETKQIPLSAMRRTIAKRLAESTGPIPHFYLTADYDVTSLMSVRQQVNDIEGVKTSLNDFIVRAVALALQSHPNINASWGSEAITQHGDIHIGIAVATPEGLITPIVRNADGKSVVQITAEIRALAEKAKNRKLKPDEYQGSTFTISNLGAWGIEEFTGIINPPNSAILAIGAAESRPVVINGQIVVRDRMKVTMSCDHRVIDGATGAEFLRTLRQLIEQPLRIVMG